MADAERAMSSEYIEWAKTHAYARFNLATSGVKACSLHEFGARLEDIELSGSSGYGYEPLQQALARKCNVSSDCVVAAIGTSQANHLAMAALLGPGDEVLVEHPAYDPLISLARHLGARVKRFPRRRETGFRVEPEEVERNVSPRTRLIVMTNLHNPSGAYTDESTVQRVGEIARGVGARVLVDEVYLEMLGLRAARSTAGPSETPWPSAFRSAFHLGNEFIATSSLTKAYGLSGLRCGWILAEPELARRIWRLNDLFCNIPAHAAERLSVLALQRLDQIARRAGILLDTNRPVLDRFLDSRPDLDTVRPICGTIVFPRMQGETEKLCALLRNKYDTSVVPGKFFEMPDHFRIGSGCEPQELAQGLDRLGACLDEIARRSKSFVEPM